VVKTAKELRKALSEKLEELNSDDVTAAGANAFANVAGKIINSAKLEMEYATLTGKTPHIDFFESEKKN
jgi:hypothetical protein